MLRLKSCIICIIFLLLTLFLNGCVKFDYHLIINEDMTVNEEIIIALDETLLVMMAYEGEDVLDELRTDAMKDGYKVEDYYEYGMIGIKANKTSKSPETLELFDLDNGQSFVDVTGFEVDSGLFSRTYYINTYLDMTDFTEEDWEFYAVMRPEMSFTLTLPSEPIEHNADTVSEDGKTLKWIPNPGQNNPIIVSFRETTINFAIVLLIIIIVSAPFIVMKLRNTKTKHKSPHEIFVEKKCEYCGNPISHGESFCSHCGEAAFQNKCEERITKCKSCGASVDKNDQFCFNCGGQQ